MDIIGAFEEKIKMNEIMPLWETYKFDLGKVLKYTNSNINKANLILDEILEDEEKICLEQAFFGDDGWYKRINGKGMNELKLAAMSLGLTNDIFRFDSKKEQKILEDLEGIDLKKQEIMIRCYLKQKLVTYVTLVKYLSDVKKTNDLSLVLYRGINTSKPAKKYFCNGLESWTLNYNTALQFARTEGYIIRKKYPVLQIFTGFRSSFKNRSQPQFRNNGFYVRREKEMIVENVEKSFDINDVLAMEEYV